MPDRYSLPLLPAMNACIPLDVVGKDQSLQKKQGGYIIHCIEWARVDVITVLQWSLVRPTIRRSDSTSSFICLGNLVFFEWAPTNVLVLWY